IRFLAPRSIAVARDGSLYIGEVNFIRKVTPDGIIRTYAGVPTCGGFFCNSGDGGPALNAKLTNLHGIALAPDGTLYISSIARIRRITPDGIITNFAGTGQFGVSADGVAAATALMAP